MSKFRQKIVCCIWDVWTAIKAKPDVPRKWLREQEGEGLEKGEATLLKK